MPIRGCNEAIFSGDYEAEIRGVIASAPSNSTFDQVLLIAQSWYDEWWNTMDPEIRRSINKGLWMLSLNDRAKELFNAIHRRRPWSANLRYTRAPQEVRQR